MYYKPDNLSCNIWEMDKKGGKRNKQKHETEKKNVLMFFCHDLKKSEISSSITT